MKQLTEIERREARIQRIEARSGHSVKTDVQEEYELVESDAGAHHVIGKSEQFPEHLGRFVETYSSDPATKV